MATLNSAVQALIDNLHTKMTSNEPLTAEEQTLVAAAIDKLSSHSSWENALVAVAEEHLNTATTNMSQTLTTATSALTDAQTDINIAKDAIQSQNANLALIPSISSNVQTALDEFGVNNTAQLQSNLAGMARPVFGVKKIETASTSGNNQRSQAVFAVYDANGESYLARPASTNNNNAYEYNRVEFLKLLADGSSKVTLKTHFTHSSTFYASPASYIYVYGSSAILPLASKDDANAIYYDVVYSTQSSASSSSSGYGGIFCATAGNTTLTKPKKNINATDQWGIPSVTSHSYNDIGVLYDNNKHCLILVDDSTSLLVEKYRDGNIITNTSIPDAATLQAYVDAGDFTTVKFIYHQINWPNIIRQFDGSNTSSSTSERIEIYGFFGKLGSELKMGGGSYNAHYRFTADKKLEPINYFLTSSVTQNRSQGSSGTANSIGDLKVALTDMQGNTLGIYSYQSKSNYAGYHAGYIACALMCINPYSHVGILNDAQVYYSTSPYYGQGRICKAF